jgi:HEAT repeat protein
MRVVAWIGTFLLALTLLLLVLVLLLRVRLLLQDKGRQKLLAVWQPILNAIEVPALDLPKLDRRDLSYFLLVWNHLHESLLDETKDHLNQIARELNIGPVALGMLRRGNLRARLLAMLTLGRLREPAAWDALLRIVRTEGALLSIVAARALVMIDAEEAVLELIPILVKRHDWPASRVATILQTAGADVISDLIARAAIASTLENTAESEKGGGDVADRIDYARLIPYLEFTHRHSALPAVRTIVQSSRDPQVLAACLRLLSTSEGLEFARECLAHEDWRVRVQAAAALGRIGRSDDEALLIPLLSDQEWWVRYRAAQALSRLPFMRESKLRSIQVSQSDPFARDMLAQVMAEVHLL